MRVLVACEFSGIVRDAFAARGHFAVSCDLLPSERPGEHAIAGSRGQHDDLGYMAALERAVREAKGEPRD